MLLHDVSLPIFPKASQTRVLLCCIIKKKIQLSFLILTFLSRVAKYSTKVELTSVRYPSVKRGVYGAITDNDLKVFESIVGSNGVITDDTELEGT